MGNIRIVGASERSRQARPSGRAGQVVYTEARQPRLARISTTGKTQSQKQRPEPRCFLRALRAARRSRPHPPPAQDGKERRRRVDEKKIGDSTSRVSSSRLTATKSIQCTSYDAANQHI